MVSKISMMRTAFATMLLFAATAASAQVSVDLRAVKGTFLQGEPIYIVADVKNVGRYPIGYGAVGHDLELEVAGRQPYVWRKACDSLWVSIGPSFFVDHPDTFGPGETRSFRYLLRGFRLEPGRHRVRVFGKAPVRWFQAQYLIGPGDPIRPVIPFGPSDPVEGAAVDREIEIEVVAGSIEDLQLAFEPLIKNSKNQYDTDLGRAGIVESAHAAHADLIAELAAHPDSLGGAAYEALADINTSASRAHLRRLYDAAAHPYLRRGIVTALARLADPDGIDFLAALLTDRNAAIADESIERIAARGLVCIGGDAAADALATGTRDWADQHERIDLLVKIGSRKAVDAIVEMPVGADFSVMLSACSGLSALTHYQWCDEDLMASVYTFPANEAIARPVFIKIQSQWRSWWQRDRSAARLYRADDPMPASLPKIW